jgi:hypothetical protein
MSQDTRQRGGCGCCGMSGCLGALLLLIVLGVATFFVVRFTWNLYSVASDQPLPAARNIIPAGAYQQARHKLDQFMQSTEIRSLSLSESEANAILTEAPELSFLGKGVSTVFRENEAELLFRVPLHLLPINTKYLNYEVLLRPVITGEKVTLNVQRVTGADKPLDSTALRDLKQRAEPSLNQFFSGLNEIQQSRAIRSIRIQNGTIVFER